MQTIFLNAAGTVLFVRDDMEQGHWTQEEYSVNATFPDAPGKRIERGMRIAFRDPATNNLEMFEIRNVTNIEPDHYQQIVAEHIVVAELSDEHLDNMELYNVTPQRALATALTGTLWAVGNVGVGDLTEQASIQASITSLGLNGNVDLTSRPIIYADKMVEAGYTSFSGTSATLYASTYTKSTSTNVAVTLLMTPIQADGTVLSQAALDSYVKDVMKASTTMASIKGKDEKGLMIHVLSGSQTSQMATIAATAQSLSDQWEECVADVNSSGTFARGSAWNAVNNIISNWNVYIAPRVTVNAAGSVTGRYLDISAHNGTWRGVRLSLDKNVYDSSVVIDDSELLTAMYGYGGTVTDTDGNSSECTFKDIVWTATDEHPAKPANQTYLEDAAKTALYGRNGRPRYGFYQNGDITDGEVLLQKTWEALQQSSSPKVSITGTVADLHRMGYADEPIRLHDTVIVDINGETYQKEIIRLDVDLIDPTATRPEIGEYIPNIIYINKATVEDVSGGGGGGGRGKDNEEEEKLKYYTEWVKTNDKIGMVVKERNGEYVLDAAEICLSINESTGATQALIRADHIILDGDTTIQSLFTGSGTALKLTVGQLAANMVSTDYISISGASGASSAYGSSFEWKSATVVTDVGVTMPSITRSNSRYFLYADSSGSTTPSNTQSGRVITAYTAGTVSPTTETIYYLGRTNAPS